MAVEQVRMVSFLSDHRRFDSFFRRTGVQKNYGPISETLRKFPVSKLKSGMKKRNDVVTVPRELSFLCRVSFGQEGFLAEALGQHPLIGPSAFLDDTGKVIVEEIEQFYFNVGERRRGFQIIITHPPR